MANILETVRAEGECSRYIMGVESITGLTEILSWPGMFTLFVPTDSAFDSLPDDQRVYLFAHPKKLSKVLRYHIVSGHFTVDDLLDRLFLKTLEGQPLRVWSSISEVPLGEKDIATYKDALTYISTKTVTTEVRQSIKINGAHIIRANINADNGIVHVIDKVLIPPFTVLNEP